MAKNKTQSDQQANITSPRICDTKKKSVNTAALTTVRGGALLGAKLVRVANADQVGDNTINTNIFIAFPNAVHRESLIVTTTKVSDFLKAHHHSANCFDEIPSCRPGYKVLLLVLRVLLFAKRFVLQNIHAVVARNLGEVNYKRLLVAASITQHILLITLKSETAPDRGVKKALPVNVNPTRGRRTVACEVQKYRQIQAIALLDCSSESSVLNNLQSSTRAKVFPTRLVENGTGAFWHVGVAARATPIKTNRLARTT